MEARARSLRILVQDGVHPSGLHSSSSSKDRVHLNVLLSSSCRNSSKEGVHLNGLHSSCSSREDLEAQPHSNWEVHTKVGEDMMVDVVARGVERPLSSFLVDLPSFISHLVDHCPRAVVGVLLVVSVEDLDLLLVDLLGHQFPSCTKLPWLHIKQG